MGRIRMKTINGSDYFYLIYKDENGDEKQKYLGKVSIFPDWFYKLVRMEPEKRGELVKQARTKPINTK